MCCWGNNILSYSLSNYVCEAFALLDYFNEIINKSDTPARTACEYTEINKLDSCKLISYLKVHECRLENLPMCSNSYKTKILKVSHS